MLLAAQGHDVLVLDRADLPADTLSTHAMSRGGVVQLERWGLRDEVVASGAPELRQASFFVDGRPTVVKPVKNRAGVDHLLAPRRYILDHILLSAAQRAGAVVETGVSVTRVLQTRDRRAVGVLVRGRDGTERALHARLVVGADGLRSRVARSVGAPIIEKHLESGAIHYTYVAGLDGEGFEFHVADRGFAGVFPTHNGEKNVFLCGPLDRALRGSTTPDDFLNLLDGAMPSLAARVRRGEITAPIRGAVAFPNHVRQAAGPGWALVGDAGYHRDPITGHGITDALRDAELLASHFGAALRGEVPEARAIAAYGAERGLALRPIFDVTRHMGSFPPIDEFVDTQRQLSALLEIEAEGLAARPPLSLRERIAA
jgi:2-polyprenyl-6-methoxyphenol hydroxylase-like FAD-dependent oxidoreductase